jgi:hypothetical protein
MRWTNGLPGAITRLGANMAPYQVFLLISDARGYSSWPGASNAPHQRSNTLMQLSRSPAKRSALRRTAGTYKRALLLSASEPKDVGRLLLRPRDRGVARGRRALFLSEVDPDLTISGVKESSVPPL